MGVKGGGIWAQLEEKDTLGRVGLASCKKQNECLLQAVIMTTAGTATRGVCQGPGIPAASSHLALTPSSRGGMIHPCVLWRKPAPRVVRSFHAWCQVTSSVPELKF